MGRHLRDSELQECRRKQDRPDDLCSDREQAHPHHQTAQDDQARRAQQGAARASQQLLAELQGQVGLNRDSDDDSDRRYGHGHLTGLPGGIRLEPDESPPILPAWSAEISDYEATQAGDHSRIGRQTTRNGHADQDPGRGQRIEVRR